MTVTLRPVSDTVVLALAAAAYPTLLAGVVVILAQPRPWRLLLGFLAGGMTISVVCGVVIVAAIRQSNRVVGVETTTRPVVDIVIGLLSLGVAWLVWHGHSHHFGWRRPRRRQQSSGAGVTQRVLSRNSALAAVAVGAVLNLPGVWYLAALNNIATAEPALNRLVQILVFNVIMFALVEIPLILFAVDPERARHVVSVLSIWVREHKRELASLLAALIGVLLIAKGVAGLG